MKSCEQFLPDLCAWMDGALEDGRELEAHLAQCASCRAILEQYRQNDAALAAVQAPAELHEWIMQGVNATHLTKTKRRFAFGPATAVAAVAAVLLLAVAAGKITIPSFKAESPAAAPRMAAYATDSAAPAEQKSELTEERTESFMLTNPETAADNDIAYVAEYDEAPAESAAEESVAGTNTAVPQEADLPETEAAEPMGSATEKANTFSVNSTVEFCKAYVASSGELNLYSTDEFGPSADTDENSVDSVIWTIRGISLTDLPAPFHGVTFNAENSSQNLDEVTSWVTSVDETQWLDLFNSCCDMLGTDPEAMELAGSLGTANVLVYTIRLIP